MTVRVIGRATAKRMTCPECLSILEFELGDVYRIQKPSLSQGVSVAVITCAGCSRVLELYQLEVRDAIHD
jgi:RNase P subunit RPR2